MWKIDYYNEAVRNEMKSWPGGLLARYVRIADLMLTNGPNLGMPFTKPLGDGLFEIRVKSHTGIGRVFFCYVVNKITYFKSIDNQCR